MQTTLEVQRLKPLGQQVLVKRGPVETMVGRFEIPQEYQDRNKIKGQLYTGVMIAVGDRTKAARFGRRVGCAQPGDKVWFWHMWDWKDHEVVLKDVASGDEYLLIPESGIYAHQYDAANGASEAA